MPITFPIGYHPLHRTKIIDYQLNRWHSLGYCDLDDMRIAATRIKTLTDWKPVMVELAERALADGRILNGAFLLRAAEFFTHPGDPDKLRLYERFSELFYNRLMAAEPIERFEVSYPGGALPALRLRHRSESVHGTLVI